LTRLSALGRVFRTARLRRLAILCAQESQGRQTSQQVHDLGPGPDHQSSQRTQTPPNRYHFLTKAAAGPRHGQLRRLASPTQPSALAKRASQPSNRRGHALLHHNPRP
jgi:hypothetical protein